MDFNADRMNFYLNGVEKGSQAPVAEARTTVHDNKLALGAMHTEDTEVLADVEMDELYVYEEPFTDSQIMLAYQAYV